MTFLYRHVVAIAVGMFLVVGVAVAWLTWYLALKVVHDWGPGIATTAIGTGLTILVVNAAFERSEYMRLKPIRDTSYQRIADLGNTYRSTIIERCASIVNYDGDTAWPLWLAEDDHRLRLADARQDGRSLLVVVAEQLAFLHARMQDIQQTMALGGFGAAEHLVSSKIAEHFAVLGELIRTVAESGGNESDRTLRTGLERDAMVLPDEAARALWPDPRRSPVGESPVLPTDSPPTVSPMHVGD